MNKRDKYPLFMRMLQRRPALALLVIYLMAALVCTRIPLLNTLGYESALLFSLLSAWVGSLLPLSMLRVFRRNPLSFNRRIGEQGRSGSDLPPMSVVVIRWLHLSLAGMLLLIVPMAVLTVNAAFVRNCSMFDGALFWLLLPFFTVAFSTAALLFFDALLGARAAYAYFAMLVLLLLQPFVQIYTQPQVYAYNHVFGMFLGLSWDQAQPPFFTLFLYRLSTLAYAALLLVVAAALLARRRPSFPAADKRTLALLSLPILAAVLFFQFSSTPLGFSNSNTYLREELGAEYRLENIRIVYDSTTIDSAAVRRIAEEHLFQLEQVCAELDVHWTRDITSYIYPDRETKRRLLGTESSDLARPWRAEVHLSADSWAATVKHELVHVVAGSFGPYLTRAPFVRVLGLTEGLAMAVEWSWGNRTLHQFCAGMLAQDILPHARTCIGTAGFVTNSSSSGYVASGSLTRWLLDSLGIDVIRKAYAADNLEEAVGMDYNEINRRWRVFLGSVPRDLPDSLAIAYAFRRPSLFSAVCPRVITERNRAASAAIAGHNPRQALKLFRAAEALAPNARSAFGIVGALYELKRWDSVLSVTGSYLADSTRAFSLFPMLLWQGAAAWQKGDSAAADRALSRLITEQLPGWPTPFAERLQRSIRVGRGTAESRGEAESVGEAESGGEAESRGEAESGGEALGTIVAERLRWDAREQDSLRLVRLEQLLRSRAEDPAVVEEYMIAVATDSTGRRKALDAWWNIEDDWAPDALRLLAVRLYYQEREWSEAQRLLRHQLNEPMSAFMRGEVIEWMARCAWQQRRLEK